MSNPILSVVIPSRNRPREVRATVLNILKTFEASDAIEILISDNSDVPYSNLPSDPRVKIVRSETRLETAEENLFFAIPFAVGSYLFPLGDDDVVLRQSLLNLMEICRSESYDAMVWNCRNVTSRYEPMGWSRVVCYSPILETTYESFLERIGFWSIPAAVSLCVFKRDLVTTLAVQEAKGLRSKIYSHVAFYATIFKEAKFAFVNQDLVLYRTNSYDLSHKNTNHWTDYSSSQGLSDRFFWTTGFIEQLQFLTSNSSLKRDYLARAVDIGHFGHRLPLLEHVTTLLLEQIAGDLSGTSRISLSEVELEGVLNYFDEIEPKYLGITMSIREISATAKTDTKNAVKLLESLQDDIKKSGASYPFHRFYHSRLRGFHIYSTPLGWLALPQGISSFVNSNPIPLHLSEMLLGIEFPEVKGIFHANSLEELSRLLAKIQISGAQLDALNIFHHATAVYKNQNSATRNSFARYIWNRLPLRARIKLKNYLMK